MCRQEAIRRKERMRSNKDEKSSYRKWDETERKRKWKGNVAEGRTCSMISSASLAAQLQLNSTTQYTIKYE